MTALRSSLLLLAAAAPAAAGDVSTGLPEPRIAVLEARSGDSLAFAEPSLGARTFTGPATAVLETLHLTSRDAVEQFLPDLAQERADLAGTSTIVLPDGGRLLRYSDPPRKRAGILHVDGSGVAHLLLERRLVRGRNPLLPEVAVSSWEPLAAVLTDEDLTGRGDVYLLRLDGGRFARSGKASQLVTGSLATPDATPTSLAFVRGALFFVDQDLTLRRAPVDGSTDAVAISLPPSGGRTPAVLSDEIAVCEDGSTLALLGGQSEKIWDIYVGSAAGTMRNLTDSPSEYEPVGHLPAPDGPFLSFTDDGSLLLYGDENPDLEVYAVATDGLSAPIQITADAWFEVSIDEGSSRFFLRRDPVAMFGEEADTRDAYRVELSGGSVGRVVNLTATSGDGDGAPWETGAEITPALVARGGRDRILLVDDRTLEVGSPTFDLWTVGAAGAILQHADLQSVPQVVVAGDAVIATAVTLLQDAAGSHLALVPPHAGLPLEVLLSAPAGIDLAGLSLRPDGQELALVARVAPGRAVVAGYTLHGRRVRLLTPSAGFVTDQTAWSPQGHLLLGFGVTSDRNAFVESPAGSGLLVSLPGTLGDPWFY